MSTNIRQVVEPTRAHGELLLTKITMLRLLCSGALVGVSVASLIAKSFGVDYPEIAVDVSGGVFGATIIGALKAAHLV